METAIIVAVATGLAISQTPIVDGNHQVPKHTGDGYHQAPVHKVVSASPCPDNAVAVTKKDGSVAYYTCRY